MTVDDAAVAVAAVEAGAAIARARFGTSMARFDKGSGDFATQADLDAEAAILEVVRSHRPDDATLGEETGLTGSTDAARTWLIDPLCGTLNYAAGTGPVAVNVALRIGADVPVAAVADAVGTDVFWAADGRAWQRLGGVDRELGPSAASRLVDVNLDGPLPNGAPFWTAALLADPDFRASFRPRVVSSTVAVAWVAAGRRAAYLTDGDLRDNVHFAAGTALCVAAGCTVTNLAGGPLHTGIGGLVAAADAESNRRLVDLIAPHLT